MTPRTSVLMPAYNAHGTIRASVESALAQTVGDLEVIVVDDGSDPPIAEALADVRDPRLRVLRHPRNRMAPAARNTALAAARRRSSPSSTPTTCGSRTTSRTCCRASTTRAVGLTYTNARILGHPHGLDVTISDPSPHPMDTFPKIAEQNPMAAVTVTMRADAVRDVGGYAEWLWVCDDYHLYLKLAQRGLAVRLRGQAAGDLPLAAARARSVLRRGAARARRPEDVRGVRAAPPAHAGAAPPGAHARQAGVRRLRGRAG